MGALCVTCKKKQVVIKRRFSKRLSALYTMTREEELKILSDRNNVIAELVNTECNYVRHLGIVVDGYMALVKDPNSEIPIPEEWNTTFETNVFSNLELIYNWHKNIFLKELERCRSDPIELGPIFEKYERKMLSMYTKYSHNKVKSEQTTNKFMEYFTNVTEKLGHMQQLNELLFKPIQRITVYHLLMDRIYKNTKQIKGLRETDSILRALMVVKNLPHNINVMMKFRDLMGYTSSDEFVVCSGDGERSQSYKVLVLAPAAPHPAIRGVLYFCQNGAKYGRIVHPSDNGKLLYHGRLLCTEGGLENRIKKTVFYKGESFMVYLFEKNILFSVVVGMNAKDKEPKCYYRNHIPVNNMMYSEVFECKFTFTIRTMHLEFTTTVDPQTINGERPKGDLVAYTCRAETEESYEGWTDALKNVLTQQYDFAGALENPKSACRN